MSGIVITAQSPNACGHYHVAANLDGEEIDLGIITDAELDAEPWTAEDKRRFLRWCLKRKRTHGLSVAQMVGRVLAGDEATNVKQYDFVGPGSQITKTNIGTTYVDVCPGANGQRVLVDCTGCTEFRVILTANLVGSGPFGVRVVRDSDSEVFHEVASIPLTGERELDSNWQALPAWATGLELLRLQMKSATASDDPIVRRAEMLIR